MCILTKNNSSKQISIGLKVSPAIRLAIIDNQEGNLYLGNSRYQIKDRYHVKYCFHCQIIGHISTDCSNKNAGSVCMYCMGKHLSIGPRLVAIKMMRECIVVLDALPLIKQMMLKTISHIMQVILSAL